MHWPLVVGLAAVTLLACPERAKAQGVEVRRTLEVGGVRRSYLWYEPSSSTPARGRPLGFVFHGGSGTAGGMAQHTGFTRLAEREGFAVVYPQGIGRRWNDGRGIHAAYDDVEFVRTLLDTLQRELRVDARRIYATGISNGAVFVHRLACDLPGTFAAIAPVAGAFPARLESRCTTVLPVGVIAFQGAADPLMPYRGHASATRRGAVLSAERSAALWARVNGCSASADSLLANRSTTDGTRVRRTSYTECRSGRAVLLYRIEGGGHTWPGGPAAGSAVGRVSRDVDATALIGQFFARTH